MQQYRVNFSLLIGLAIGTLVCSGAVYGLWRFQIERKSGWLLSEAEQAHKDGNFRDEVKYYWRYLTINRSDDDARVNYARAYADLAKEEDVTGEEINLAWQHLERTVRDRRLGTHPETKKLRRSLAEIFGRVGRYQDALDHLGYLIDKDPEDVDLQVLRVTYLIRSSNPDKAIEHAYKLIGYDPESDTFDADKAKAPDKVEVYANLAGILRAKQSAPELANRVMDRMIEVNPESAEAYLARGQYRLTGGDEEKEGATADIEKAYQLKPEDAEVLLNIAVVSAENKEFEKAREYVEQGKKHFPKDERFYQVAADIEIKQENYKEALAEIDAGLKAIGDKGSLLMFVKANLQFNARDIPGLRKTIEDMKRAGFPSEYPDWFEARIFAAEEKWQPAAEALSRLKPRLVNSPRLGLNVIEIDYLLGLCNERLAMYDLAYDYYELVVQANPEHELGIAGKERVGASAGRVAEQSNTDTLESRINEFLKQPKEEQDATVLSEMVKKLADERKMDEPSRKLLEAQLMMVREDFAGTRKALAEANKLKPNDLLIHRALVQLTRVDPQAGPEKALKMWDTVAIQFKDQEQALADLRLDKADILMALKKDDLRAELASLFAGTENWPVQEKVELWGGMSQKYLSLGLMDEARQYLLLAADNRPNELPLRMSLFMLALDANDDAGMKQAQEKVLEIVKDRNDSNFLYTEARRKLSQLRRGEVGKEVTNEIRQLINRAQEQRPDWHEPYVISAELELQDGNYAQALRQFDEAARRGRLYPRAVAQHIELLYRFGRFAEAGRQMERLSEPLRQSLLGPLYPEILFLTDQRDTALKEARAATEREPENPQNYYWYSQLLSRSARVPGVSDEQRKKAINDAISAMRRVVEIQPEYPDAWYGLITYHLMLRDAVQAQKTLRDAQLALNGDNLQLFLAKSYEALLRWFDAETMYRAVYEAKPDELARAQQLAAFYLGPVYPLPDKQQKAAPLINQMLRAGAEGKIAASDPNLQWARRMGARMLAATGEYQNLIKAENLLTSNVQAGIFAVEDKVEMARILQTRPEPRSRLRAVQLLEEVRKSQAQALGEQEEIILGSLYFALGEWSKYASQMDMVTNRYPESAAARETYARRLLERGDPQSISKATTHITKLRQLAPNHTASFELTVRLADKLGRQPQARAELLRMLPDIAAIQELNRQQLEMLLIFAELFIELDDLDTAEKIYTNLAAREPSMSDDLAVFLGTHRGVDQAFEKLNEIYQSDRIPDILRAALDVVREKRDQVGDKYDPQIERWLDVGLLENPDSINLLMAKADFFDIQRRYDESAAIYRKLLERNELTGFRRAIVLNNLAFLLALEGSAAAADADPLKLVKESADILGPNSDILDTRAMVWIARGQYKNAIQDLELSVTDNPTAAKYFHKAMAHLLARENREAVDAWEKAEELGLSRESLNRMEYEKYDETKAKIDQIRGGGASVTQSDTLRKAG